MSQLLPGILGLVTSRDVILTVGLFVVTFAVSLGVISFILVKLPPTYFQESHSRTFLDGHRPAVRWAGLIGKNALGVVLILLGIVMSVPGIPGQGILTILLGIMLVDVPGKRRVESRILKQPKVLEKINELRHKFSKPPLVLD